MTIVTAAPAKDTHWVRVRVRVRMQRTELAAVPARTLGYCCTRHIRGDGQWVGGRSSPGHGHSRGLRTALPALTVSMALLLCVWSGIHLMNPSKLHEF